MSSVTVALTNWLLFVREIHTCTFLDTCSQFGGAVVHHLAPWLLYQDGRVLGQSGQSYPASACLLEMQHQHKLHANCIIYDNPTH